MKLRLILLLLLAAPNLRAADTLRVLFVGNSYVQVNNLPDLIANIAADRGKVLQYGDASVGGQTFQGHHGSTNTLNLLRQKGWDAVVLQEQSQRPAFPDGQVAQDTYPYAKKLDSLVHVYNPCAKTVFYMTWGRKNGDAGNCPFFPLICTYEGMDSLLQSRYQIMAQQNKAVLSPVAVAWRMLRLVHPSIELFQPDESHPSLAGSYLAACTFYSVLFKADPSLVTYDPGLPAGEAIAIRNMVKKTVFDSLQKWYAYDVPAPVPLAAFRPTMMAGHFVRFSNTSQHARSYRWDFGDGKGDTAKAPTHVYAFDGRYTVRLIAENCENSDTATDTVEIVPIGVRGIGQQAGLNVYPNPAGNRVWLDLPQTALTLDLINLHGQIVESRALQGLRNIEIDLATVPAGSYLLRLTLQNGAVIREKLIVAH